MPKRAQVLYEALVVCEDVRLEFDNKRTLVGAYTANIIGVPQLPFDVALAIFASATVEAAGAFRPSVRVTDSDGETIYFEEAEHDVMLNAGRLTQNLVLYLKIQKEGPTKFTLYDNGKAVASSIHRIGVLSRESQLPDFGNLS